MNASDLPPRRHAAQSRDTGGGCAGLGVHPAAAPDRSPLALWGSLSDPAVAYRPAATYRARWNPATPGATFFRSFVADPYGDAAGDGGDGGGDCDDAGPDANPSPETAQDAGAEPGMWTVDRYWQCLPDAATPSADDATADGLPGPTGDEVHLAGHHAGGLGGNAWRDEYEPIIAHIRERLLSGPDLPRHPDSQREG
jgi:hypothetical protein